MVTKQRKHIPADEPRSSPIQHPVVPGSILRNIGISNTRILSKERELDRNSGIPKGGLGIRDLQNPPEKKRASVSREFGKDVLTNVGSPITGEDLRRAEQEAHKDKKGKEKRG